MEESRSTAKSTRLNLETQIDSKGAGFGDDVIVPRLSRKKNHLSHSTIHHVDRTFTKHKCGTKYLWTNNKLGNQGPCAALGYRTTEHRVYARSGKQPVDS